MSGTSISRKKKNASLRELLWFEIDQRHTANKPPKISKATLSQLAHSFFVLFLFLWDCFFVCLFVLFPNKKITEPFGFIIEISQKDNIPVYDSLIAVLDFKDLYFTMAVTRVYSNHPVRSKASFMMF